MSSEFRIVIPARYASSRLPGKPLRQIHGKSMIEWVYQAAASSNAIEIVVATDDQRIATAVEAFGGKACITDSQHRSGTDRILEVCKRFGWVNDSIVVNLQGDEPLMPAQNMDQVAANLAEHGSDMATLYEIIDAEQAADINQVKLVHDRSGRALYFSRSVIPHSQQGASSQYFGHIGIYAYCVGFIETFSRLPSDPLETAESLEQLRALAHGYSIHAEIAVATPGPGIDTESDLQRAAALMA